MGHFRFTLAVLVLMLPTIASAQVFRCTNSAGKVEYADSPCPGGGGRAVTVNQNILPGPAVREQALRAENQLLRKELAGRSTQPVANPSPSPAAGSTQSFGRTEADLAAEKGGSIECSRAKRNYEVATSSIQPNRNTDADELALYSACGIKPPDKTIVNVTNVTNVIVGNSGRPSRLTNCNRQGCWDDLGNRYNRGSNGVFVGPRGACRQVGPQLNCP
jgi:hypothetical protein